MHTEIGPKASRADMRIFTLESFANYILKIVIYGLK